MEELKLMLRCSCVLYYTVVVEVLTCRMLRCSCVHKVVNLLSNQVDLLLEPLICSSLNIHDYSSSQELV